MNGIVCAKVDPLLRWGSPAARRDRGGFFLLCLQLLLLLPPPAPAATPWLPVDAALAGHAAGTLLFVDLRPASAYARAHIPGAINVPPFALATRRFPPDRPVVLVGRGHRPPPAAGPGAGALAGGIALWARRGGPLRGPAADGAGDRGLPPAAFEAARRGPDAHVLDASRTRHPRAEALLPDALHVPLGDRVGFEQVLSALSADAPAGRVVLLCDRAGEQATELAAAAAGVRDVAVFVLSGGVDALARHVEARAVPRPARRVGARPAAGRAPCGSCP
jgi:rhodanese-related sulfurtransferase